MQTAFGSHVHEGIQAAPTGDEPSEATVLHDFAIPVRFGIEIEMSNISLPRMHETVVAALHLPPPANVSPRSQRHHDVTDGQGRVWEVKVDCGAVNELATPILSTHEDLTTLSGVAASLAGVGACILGESGLHIHVDAASFMPRDIINIVALFARYQGPLERALQVRPERHGYCKVLDPDIAHRLRRGRDLPREDFFAMCLSYTGGRNRNVNLTNLIQKNKHTVEFRMFNATLDPSVIAHYTAVVMGIVGAAKSEVDFYEHMLQNTAPTLSQFCAHIGLDSERGAGAYLLAQAAHSESKPRALPSLHRRPSRNFFSEEKLKLT